MKTLGGASFLYNGISQDYCYRESIECLIELCDEVAICIGGEDGSVEDVIRLVENRKKDINVKIIHFSKDEWVNQKGREKLSYFSNMAISALKTDWVYYQQMDEILHERSFGYVRDAIEFPDVESYMCKRYNCWRDPLSHLVVEQSRKPCSDEVIRLAKSKYRCFNDAESLMAPSTHKYQLVGSEAPPFEIYHVGFIRDEIKQVVKSRNMLVDIFGLQWDERIGNKFDYRNFPFQGDDIQPVPLPVPKFIKQWLMIRHPDFADQLSE